MRAAPTVTLKASTWSRDSHGLFDYECRSVARKTIRSNQGGKIIRVAEDVQLLADGQPDVDVKVLARMKFKDGNFFVQHGFSSTSAPEKLWLVVKSIKNKNGTKGYRLHDGDYLKLGRVKMRVKEIVVETPPLVEPTLASSADEDPEADAVEAAVEEGALEDEATCEDPSSSLQCRICLCEGSEPGNPLISPCRCKGTMKNVHLKCLRSWIEGRMNAPPSGSGSSGVATSVTTVTTARSSSGGPSASTTRQSMSFQWRAFDCELCKVQFAPTVQVDGATQDLFQIPKPSPPYLVLEVMSREQGVARGIHVIGLMERTQVKLGRGNDCDVRVSDISVSRVHATVRYSKGEFFLEDNNSKFGTLVMIKRPIKLDRNIGGSFSVQVGRSVLAFSMKKPWSFIPSCFRSDDSSPESVEDSSNSVNLS